MAGFHEVSFPDDIGYGSRGGPGFKTQIVVLDSGAEQRAGRWSTPRHRYNVAYGIKTHTQLGVVKQFFIARLGALNGFRFKDRSDFSTDSTWRGTPAATDIHFATGDGSTSAFQLIKPYQSGGVIRNRMVTKPIGGTIRIAVDGVELFSGWTVNSTNGLVTFSSNPTNGSILTWGGEFEVPVRFEDNVDEFLSASIEDFSTGGIDQLNLVEIVDTGSIPEEFHYGGSNKYSISSNVSITHGQGRVHVITPTTSGLSVTLPDMTNRPGGGPHFYIINGSGSNTLAVKKHGGTSVNTLATNAGAAYVYDKQNGIWYAI